MKILKFGVILRNMFRLFHFEKKVTPDSNRGLEAKVNERSTKDLENLLRQNKFAEAKNYLKDNQTNLNSSRAIGLFLENLLNDPGGEEFRDLNHFLEAEIIPLETLKQDKVISLYLQQAIENLEKDNNYNALSRLMILGLLDKAGDAELKVAA